MHVEVPKAKFGSIKEFGGEYLMIVISVLTALALEHGVQNLHHTHRAHETATLLDAELRLNVVQIQNARKSNLEQAGLLQHLSEVLLKDIQAKLPEDKIVEHFSSEAKGKFNLLINTPSLRHDAWDVAVANQSAGWMTPETMQRFSRAYTTVNSTPDLITGNMATLLNGQRMVEVLSDLEDGSVKPRELRHTLSQMIAVHGITDMIMDIAEKKLVRDLPAPAVH